MLAFLHSCALISHVQCYTLLWSTRRWRMKDVCGLDLCWTSVYRILGNTESRSQSLSTLTLAGPRFFHFNDRSDSQRAQSFSCGYLYLVHALCKHPVSFRTMFV